MLDATIVRQLAADLSPADIRRVLETFETDLCRLTAQLEAAAASGDTHAYRHAAHGLVGASAAVGAAALERMARLALGVGGQTDLPGLAARIRAEAAETLKALARLMPEGEAA